MYVFQILYFPVDGAFVSRKEKQAEVHFLVLTDAEGSKSYATCLNYFVPHVVTEVLLHPDPTPPSPVLTPPNSTYLPLPYANTDVLCISLLSFQLSDGTYDVRMTSSDTTSISSDDVMSKSEVCYLPTSLVLVSHQPRFLLLKALASRFY